jgi:hypothetical protein
MRQMRLKPILLAAAAGYAGASCLSCLAKTELRHCVDSSGEVQPEQVCARGQAGYQWVYGGEPDPNRPGRMINYSLTPTEGANVVSPSGPKP